MKKPFNFFQARILKALTRALFHDVDMVITPNQVVKNLQYQFSLIEGGKPTEIGITLYAIAAALGPFFTFVGPARGAKRIADRLESTRNDLLQDLGRLRGVIYAGYYGHWIGETQEHNQHNPVLAQIGFTLPQFRDRAEPADRLIEPFYGRDLSPADLVGHANIPDEVDVIVVGSGAGGAVAAANMTRHGHDVLIVEAGALWASDDLSHEERRMTSKLFVDGALQSTRDHDVFVFQAHCVGGGTVINNGICLRVNQPGMTHPDAPDVLRNWADLGAPVDVARFDAAYEAITARLSIKPIAHRAAKHNGPHLLNGWSALTADSTDPRDTLAPAVWFSKNFGPPDSDAECAYCGYCNTGCPYGRKQGMAQSFLIDAHKAGARILAEAKAQAILWGDDRADGKQVAEAVCVTLPDGSEKLIRARKGVVVACGTLASSRLLQASGVSNAGKDISLNIACPVVALMPDEQRAWDEDQMATYVDCADFLLESHFQPPMSMASLMPGWIGDHAFRMRNYNRLASAGTLIPADRRGWLIDGQLHLKLREDVEIPNLRRALATLCKVHFAAGALEVYPALARGQTLYPHDDIDAILESAIQEADDVTLSSSHPHGGNARNADPDKGVIDLECRVHGTTNVLVTDGKSLKLMENWMRSYEPESLFDEAGRLVEELRELAPKGARRISANPHANGGLLCKTLDMPAFGDYAVAVKKPGGTYTSPTEVLGKFLCDVMRRNMTNFRVFGPDETASNKLTAIYEASEKTWLAQTEPSDADGGDLAVDGRVMEMLSEHTLEGWFEGYVLTGRHGLFATYEAFVHVIDSMFNQHAKWLEKAKRDLGWRQPVPSINLLITSLVWRQDHNGFTHQDPGFLDVVTNKSPDVVRIYLPPDANCLLSVADHCLRSRDYVNVIVADKQPHLQYLDMDAAVIHCTKGIGIWDWASTDQGVEPDVVIASAGDIATMEALAAVQILKERFADLKIRFVNVVDLFRLMPEHAHPHGLSNRDFDSLFTATKPVIFNFHSYASLVHKLTYNRTNHDNLHVHGYHEKGNINTPLELAIINQVDRFSLAIDVIDRVPKLRGVGDHAKEWLRGQVIEHLAYAHAEGIDREEIRNWTWKG